MLNVRRLAALDMALHGARFTVLEFAAGAVLCMLLGAFSLAVGLRLLAHGFAWRLVFGALLLTVGLNYIPLLLHVHQTPFGKVHPGQEPVRPAGPGRGCRPYPLLHLRGRPRRPHRRGRYRQTVAIRAATDGLDPTSYQVIYIANPAFGTRGLYLTIVSALGPSPASIRPS